MLVFNEWLKSVLKEKKMTRQALALYAGISESSLCSWMQGCSPNMNKAQQIIEYLGYEIRIVKKGTPESAFDDDLK